MARIQDVRSAFFRKGCTVSEIAKEYRVERKTVRKYIMQDDWAEAKRRGPAEREGTLDPDKPRMDIERSGNVVSRLGTVVSSSVDVQRRAQSIWISSPSNGATLYSQATTVSGTSAGLAGKVLHLIVVTDRGYYQQDVSVANNGSWSGTVWIGPGTLYSDFSASVYATTPDATISGDHVLNDGIVTSQLVHVTRVR